ncbi:LysM domain containing protein [Parasponia andersonii]|uniref:LysM domain containing protein n=1 Tax=Parasponia andersonii TaxID=3476 RepID=A0A2P5DCA6_PARAD|nr:LysM domain containing protein [Parasponia andersonii]
MANSNNQTMTSTLYLVLMLSLLLTVSIAESRLFGKLAIGIGKPPAAATPKCDSVYGVQSGDTCFGITQMFNLTTDFFSSINPNLNCTALFVGQWLCTDGTAA